MIGIDRKMIKSFDIPLFLIMVILILFGLVAIINATAMLVTNDEGGIANALQFIDWEYVRLQSMWAISGLVLMAIVLLVDYRFVKNIAWIAFAVLVLLLGAVLTQEAGRGGVKAWFYIGSTRTFQPSEIGKLFIIVVLAWRISKVGKPITTVWEFAGLIPFIAIPAGIIVLQRDVGTMMVYVAIFIGMLFMSGINLKLFVGLMAVMALVIVPLWFVLSDWQQNRILTLLDPTRDTANSSYNVTQALIAIGSGGMFGKGLLARGSMAQLDQVPEAYNDFIFSVTCEALGFVGAAALVALFLLFMWRMLYIAGTVRDKFGQLIITGVVSMMLFHIFENIGMNVNVMPVTGIPLPFISYGGSNLWTNMLAVAMVLNVGLRRDKKPI